MPEGQQTAEAVNTFTYDDITHMPLYLKGVWFEGEAHRLMVIGDRGGAVFGHYGNSHLGIGQRIMRVQLPDHRNGQGVCDCLARIDENDSAISFFEVTGPFTITPIYDNE